MSSFYKFTSEDMPRVQDTRKKKKGENYQTNGGKLRFVNGRNRLFDCRYSFWMSLPFQGEISSIKDERKKMEKDLLLLQQSNMFRLRWALKNNIRLRGILQLTLYLSKIFRKKFITQSLVI